MERTYQRILIKKGRGYRKLSGRSLKRGEVWTTIRGALLVIGGVIIKMGGVILIMGGVLLIMGGVLLIIGDPY